MKDQTSIATNKKSIFWIASVLAIICGTTFIYFQYAKSTLDILPIINEIRNHEKPMATPATFAEDFTENASESKLVFNKTE